MGDMMPARRAANQENLDEADFMETKFLSLPRKISCKARWSTPKAPQGHKYTPGDMGKRCTQLIMWVSMMQMPVRVKNYF
jgi:hypothetical protein